MPQLGRNTQKVSIRKNTVYQDAQRRFRNGDIAEALERIDTLLKTPDLPLADRNYLLRQKEICQRRLDTKGTQNAAGSTTKPLAPPPPDCGLRALALACERLGVKVHSDTLATAAGMTAEGTTLAGLTRAAASVGVTATGLQSDATALARLDQPALAWVDATHFVAVLEVRSPLLGGEPEALVRDPNQPTAEWWSVQTLLSRSGGVLLTLQKAKSKP